MAMPIKRQVERAQATLDRAHNAVFAAAAPRNDVRFSDCYAMASAEVRAAFDAARAHLNALQDEAVRTGKAWRGAYSLLMWNDNRRTISARRKA